MLHSILIVFPLTLIPTIAILSLITIYCRYIPLLTNVPSLLELCGSYYQQKDFTFPPLVAPPSAHTNPISVLVHSPPCMYMISYIFLLFVCSFSGCLTTNQATTLSLSFPSTVLQLTAASSLITTNPLGLQPPSLSSPAIVLVISFRIAACLLISGL
jgi:hypothetical protein